MKYTYLAFATLAGLALAAPQTTPALTEADINGIITPQRVLEICYDPAAGCSVGRRMGRLHEPPRGGNHWRENPGRIGRVSDRSIRGLITLTGIRIEGIESRFTRLTSRDGLYSRCNFLSL
ncbi:hypothetical protein X797_008987 [Metarhizium robertsii]|uniref:Uncharacterized protein n=1 Tax=Metarhizium robertsii TaxID=568076 RepID=A0A014MZX3_9HYPO|nr:hypothetical protein X797_008987 [Metarhizium robertsii]